MRSKTAKKAIFRGFSSSDDNDTSTVKRDVDSATGTTIIKYKLAADGNSFEVTGGNWGDVDIKGTYSR